MKYVWDPLNRMEILFRPSVGASYYYGQMPIEEDYNPSGTVTKVTRNTLGGRGIDMISTTTSSATEDRYPLYDGHGNMIATLGRNGSGGYAIGDSRTYDVWGSVRSGAASGDPTKRYSANLGHQADDESGLLYMRARYYEPGSGRFVSEDDIPDGTNWYSYCSNQPISNSDFSGNELGGEWFQLGKYWIRLDTWYPESGTGHMVRDWNWGTKEGEVLGTFRFDGLRKGSHAGLKPPEKLFKLLWRSEKFSKWVQKTGEQYYSRKYGIGYTTLDTAFMMDPLFVIGCFMDIGGGMHLFGNLDG